MKHESWQDVLMSEFSAKDCEVTTFYEGKMMSLSNVIHLFARIRLERARHVAGIWAWRRISSTFYDKRKLLQQTSGLQGDMYTQPKDASAINGKLISTDRDSPPS
jgi:hypothetical protein